MISAVLHLRRVLLLQLLDLQLLDLCNASFVAQTILADAGECTHCLPQNH